jgi:hypothetical protein
MYLNVLYGYDLALFHFAFVLVLYYIFTHAHPFLDVTRAFTAGDEV